MPVVVRETWHAYIKVPIPIIDQTCIIRYSLSIAVEEGRIKLEGLEPVLLTT